VNELIAFLRARLDEDEADALADDRHWSEVPINLFSGHRAVQEAQAKRVVVEVLARCTDHSWTGTYAVVEEARRALRALVQPYAGRHPEYDHAWTSPPTGETLPGGRPFTEPVIPVGCTCVWPGTAYDHGEVDRNCPDHGARRSAVTGG
jgi:hypothetical protein